jgi:hypothetical protein
MPESWQLYGHKHSGNMGAIKFRKITSWPPATLDANTIYVVDRGSGLADMYVTTAGANPIARLIARQGTAIQTNGTYTPVVTGSTSDPIGGSYSDRFGNWIRTGNVMNVWASLKFEGWSGGIGFFRVSLPSLNSTEAYSGATGSASVRGFNFSLGFSSVCLELLGTGHVSFVLSGDGKTTNSVLTFDSANSFNVTVKFQITLQIITIS